MSATEELLKSANLVVLWSFIQDLQKRTGIDTCSAGTGSSSSTFAVAT